MESSNVQKKIGEVILDYTFYKGKDLYSDGQIEEELLEACKSGTQEKMLLQSNQWPVLYHLSDIRENLLEWYPFSGKEDILEIGAGCGAITGILSKKTKNVTCIELSERRSLINAYRNKKCNNIEILIGNFQDIEPHLQRYDYITLIGVWEYSGLYIESDNPYLEMLLAVKKHLKPNGKIIIAIENKVGLKYWNGAQEDHTGKLYSGLNDYIGEKNVRTFSKREIEALVYAAGIDECVFYYPMPDYKLPECIYSECVQPKAGNIRYYKQDYSSSRLYNFFDATAFDQICADGMFSYFANSYLLVCGEGEQQTCFEKYSKMRKKEYRIVTGIRERADGKYIIKRALTEEAEKHIQQLKVNEELWVGTLKKLQYVSGKIINGNYETPYIEGVDADTYLYQWRNDERTFEENIKQLIEQYLMPDASEIIPFKITDKFKEVFGEIVPDKADSLRVTNIDLTFSNLKLVGDKIVNFDYEWVFDFEIPYEYVLWRAVWQLYQKYAVYLKPRITEQEFCVNVGIVCENIHIYKAMEKKFSEYVFGINSSEDYLRNYQRDSIMQTIRFA